MQELLKKLVEAHGPSGFEEEVRQVIRAEIEMLADELTTDAMGNLIALKKGSGEGVKVLVAAHMDEIGLMVTHITKEGFLRFTKLGGVNVRTLMGARVRFSNGISGVVHCDRVTEAGKVHPLEKHFIDVGASSEQDCPVQVGDAASFERAFLADGNRLIGKSMDDRIGCLVGIEALRQLSNSPHDVYFLFSVQEEVGTRGAEVAANRIEPDVGIALDVTRTGDVPESAAMAVALGKGPAIKVKDSGMIAHGGLVRLMRKRAEEANLAYQLEVLESGTTDARPIQMANRGSAAGCISIPCRYIHSQSETVNTEDVEGVIKLLVAILEQPIAL